MGTSLHNDETSDNQNISSSRINKSKSNNSMFAPGKSNLIKALNQAIDEFIEDGIDTLHNNRRVIIIFTSLFYMPPDKQKELD